MRPWYHASVVSCGRGIMRAWYNKSMNSKKWVWVLLIIVVILVATAGGVIYWSFNKAKKVADSALHSVQSNQTPSSSSSPGASSLQSPQSTLSMPASDVIGEDLADVPRFPDSIRTSYEKQTADVVNLEYMAKASQDQILKFYKDQLPARGWLLRAEDPTSLSFSNDNADLSIEIIEQDKTAGITHYKIHYIMTQNTQ